MEMEQYSTESSLGHGRNKEGNKTLPRIQQKWKKTHSNLCNTIKMVIRGKIRALIAYIRKLEKSHASDLMTHLKATGQKGKLTQEE